MTDKEIVIDYGKIAAEVKASLKAELEAEAEAKAAQEAQVKAHVEAALKAQEEKHQEELKVLQNKKAAPAFNQRVGKQSKSAGADEFLNWMKTGDNGAGRVLKFDPMDDADENGAKALQIGSDTEGGYLVPEDFYSTIIEKRDQIAWTRNVGINVITTSLNSVPVPTESTTMGNFVVTAEEGSYDDADPIFGQVDIQTYKFTRTNKISEELLGDEGANLEQYYANVLSRSMAKTESYMVAVGTGSSQPQGVFVGGTAGLTFDSDVNITADEIPELFYKLGNGYRQNSVWLANDATEGYLRMIRDANNWAFDPWGSNMGVQGDWQFSTFFGGRPIYTESAIATRATGNKTLLIGNFEFYGLVERQGLTVSRNPYLYEASGQVGFFARYRQGGAVLQAEAFQYGTMA